MKILVVSDSHGHTGTLGKIIEQEVPFDYIVHCGDGAADLFRVEVPPGTRVVRVSGNVDLGRGLVLERSELFDVNGVRILVVHGDEYGVRKTLKKLRHEGKFSGADIVLFGHTHLPVLSKRSPMLFNPGPAESGRYGIITIGKAIEFMHKTLKEKGDPECN